MKFTIDNITNLEDLVDELGMGINRLSLVDNFAGFESKGLKIDAGSTARIKNNLDFIPERYIIIKQMGNGLVTIPSPNEDKTNVWDKDALFLKNNGTETVTITVVFMR